VCDEKVYQSKPNGLQEGTTKKHGAKWVPSHQVLKPSTTGSINEMEFHDEIWMEVLLNFVYKKKVHNERNKQKSNKYFEQKVERYSCYGFGMFNNKNFHILKQMAVFLILIATLTSVKASVTVNQKRNNCQERRGN